MGLAMFYHLTRSPAEAVLPMILGKALAAGWRVTVRGTDPARLDALDAALWLHPEDGFLPHGRAGGAHDADQPVLLSEGPGTPNGAACLVCIDGAAVEPDECAALERVCILFDGNDAAALDRARGQWKALTGAGIPAQYWSEDSGRWQMRSARGG